VDHPPWCDRSRCHAARGGPHVGERHVIAGDGGELAALWRVGGNGSTVVHMSAAEGRAWGPAQLQELSLLAARMADRLARDR
jgi:hypothetical protein